MNKYQALLKLMKQYQKAYDEGKPLISDEHYDLLFKELQDLEKKYGSEADSPTQKVGYLESDREILKHLKPMLSLEHEVGAEGIDVFTKRIERLIGKQIGRLIAQPKIDGVSVALRYKHGILVSAVLRGDGVEGENITANILSLNIPIQFNLMDAQDFEIRGELYIPLNEHEALKDFASSRHAVAGAVRLLNAEEFRTRKVAFLAYGFATERMLPELSYLKIMEEIGKHFNCVSEYVCEDEATAKALFAKLQAERLSWNYLADGVVFKVDNMNLWDELSYSAKAPRYAFAIKFPGNKAISEIESVEWSVGRTGIVTPVLKIKKIAIDGVEISSITLHNLSEFKRHNIYQGDKAIIERACDVIPAIVDVIHNEQGVDYKVPVYCPSCKQKLIQDDKFLLCQNGWECKDQVVDRIFHFLSRSAFDIEGLGLKKVEFLYDHKLLKEYRDVFLLEQHKQWLTMQEGWGEKSVNKLLAHIESKKEIGFARFLYALGIDGIGKNVAQKIASYVDSWQAFKTWVETDMLEVDGLGEKLLESIKEFISKNDQKVLELLSYISVKSDKSHYTGEKIYVVFTGTFAVSRQAMKLQTSKYEDIECVDTVSSKVKYLVYGDKAGSKLNKAKKIGIVCLNEEEWKNFLASKA